MKREPIPDYSEGEPLVVDVEDEPSLEEKYKKAKEKLSESVELITTALAEIEGGDTITAETIEKMDAGTADVKEKLTDFVKAYVAYETKKSELQAKETKDRIAGLETYLTPKK